MENIKSNPYQAPESDVGSQELSEGIMNFERFSAWAVFGLSIVTLGIYPIYWLYTRSNTLNSFHSNKISPTLLTIFVVSVAASFIAGVLEPTEGAALMVSALINLVYAILYLVVLFALRNRLNELVRDNISPLITFFGSAIYLQYAINKGIDQRSAPIL